MATKKPGTAVGPVKSTAVVNWEERMAAMAKDSVAQEASVASGSFIKTRAGQLTWQDRPFPGNKFEAIIIDSILENNFYEGEFDPDTPETPVCYAFGRDDKTMAPHPDSEKPQAKTCAECPHNQWGTADKGNGKACKNVRRIALVSASPLNETAVEKGELAFMKPSVTSVKGWAAYVRSVSALRKRPPIGVVTQISAVPDPKTVFKILFDYVSDLPGPLLSAAMARYEKVKDEIIFPYPKRAEGAAAAGKKPAAKKRKY